MPDKETALAGWNEEDFIARLGAGVVTKASGAGGFLTIEFRHNLAAQDLVYAVEVSDDLSAWACGPEETVLLGSVRQGEGSGLETHRCIAPIGEVPHHFIGLRVEVAP